MSRSILVNRRTVLRGTGVSVALPLLEAMIRPGRAAAQTRPRRLVTFFTPNGTIADAWKPKTTGTGYALTRILTPLAAHKARIAVLSGIGQRVSGAQVRNDHAQGIIAGLSGLPLMKGTLGCFGGPCGFPTGMSIDQMIGDHIGATTKFRTFEFGAGPSRPAGIFATAFLRGSTQLIPDYNPSSTFSRLFGSGAAPSGGAAAPSTDAAIRRVWTERKSVMDAVKADFDNLRGRLGSEDRIKLDAHIESLRDVERRIVGATAPVAGSAPVAPAAGCSKPAAPAAGGDTRTQGKLQMDLLALALACDLTRVANFQWETSSGSGSFPWIGVGGNHHSISHDGSAGATESLTKINVWYAEQFAYLLDKLVSTRDATGASLFDTSAILWWNELGDGRSHSRGNIPYVLAGSPSYFRLGGHIAFSGAGHTDLLLTLTQAFGHPAAAIGNPPTSMGPCESCWCNRRTLEAAWHEGGRLFVAGGLGFYTGGVIDLHFDGKSWRREIVPGAGDLNAISGLRDTLIVVGTQESTSEGVDPPAAAAGSRAAKQTLA